MVQGKHFCYCAQQLSAKRLTLAHNSKKHFARLCKKIKSIGLQLNYFFDLETNEKMFFQKMADAAEYYNKSYVFFIYNNGKEWENKKINVIDH